MRGDIESLSVTRAEAEKSLQDFLAARCGLSRRAAKALIDARAIWVNRKCVWIAHHTLKVGDEVSFARAVLSAAKRGVAAPRAMEHPGASSARGVGRTVGGEKRHLRVLVETPDYLVVDKPAGILSCLEEAQETSLTERPRANAETLLREQLRMPALEAVHRLDRDTTGCLLFAKTHAAFLAAVEVFKTKRVRKTYFAITVGRFAHAHETIDAPLDGKPAISHVTREAATDDASFLKIGLETGRTNQIRRHLASLRAPIVGDRMFGLKTARDARLMTVPRQMLHAADLELPDPMHAVKEGIRAHAPLPADFRETLALFGMGKQSFRAPRRRNENGRKNSRNMV